MKKNIILLSILGILCFWGTQFEILKPDAFIEGKIVQVAVTDIRSDANITIKSHNDIVVVKYEDLTAEFDITNYKLFSQMKIGDMINGHLNTYKTYEGNYYERLEYYNN